MRKALKPLCNFIVTMVFVIMMLYITFFTNIPAKTGNLVRQKIEEYQKQYSEYNENFQINNLEIEMKDYYYNRLTDEQKLIYISIANAVKDLEKEFLVRSYIAGNKDEFAAEVAKSIAAFINDHPEVFYLQSQYSSYIVESFNGNIGYIKLNYTEETIEAVNEKIRLINEKIDEYIKELDGRSEYEKELIIHDKFANAVTYIDDEDLSRKYHTIEGPLLENSGVCDGFTKSLQIMLSKCGIDSIIVLGTLDGSQHAWNLVNLEDEWYHVDITSSRSIYNETGIVTHAYFNLSDEKIKSICEIDNKSIIPEANGEKYNYYNYTDRIIKENDSLDGRLKDIYEKSVETDYIEFLLEGNVSDRISDILIGLKKIDKNFINGNKLYYYNIKNAIIIPKN